MANKRTNQIAKNVDTLHNNATTMTQKLDELEQYSRRNCLRIHGLKESRDEKLTYSALTSSIRSLSWLFQSWNKERKTNAIDLANVIPISIQFHKGLNIPTCPLCSISLPPMESDSGRCLHIFLIHFYVKYMSKILQDVMMHCNWNCMFVNA